ncbi:MAG: FtsX-like permease family protein [Planctomycetes bacterium]|nr:FtsX-like permease family protein [Planctomycetota bacterium]
MNRARLVLRSLLHFRATHLGAVAGVATAAAVLAGALLVGASVQASLRDRALLRIGRIDLAVGDGARTCRAALAGELRAELAGAEAAPVLQFAAIAATGDETHRAIDVQLLGVDERFFRLGPGTAPAPLPGPGQVHLNRSLAARLQAGPGARLVLRIEPGQGMPRESVLGGGPTAWRALAVQVARVVDESGFGRFGLEAAPLPPQLAFAPLGWLQDELGLPGRCNRILLGGATAPAAAAAALRARFTLADAGLSSRELPDGTTEVTSDRVLLPPPAAAAAARLPQRVMGVSTWLATELRAGERSAAYALVTALGPASAGAGHPAPVAPPWHEVLPPGLADDALVVGRWLADELGIGPGDRVDLRCWQLGSDHRLGETAHPLRVAAVVERQGLAADRGLMPPFPGIASARSCREWQPGVPLEPGRIREADEAYWREYGGTPKAFVTLAAGRQLWGDERFGSLTALRVGPAEAAAFLQALRDALDPAELGLTVRDVRTKALAASTPATDFGGLFLGLSMFLIASALLLAALLLGLGALQRAPELGTLLALGFRPSVVRRLLLAEAAVLAALGALLGALLAPAAAQTLLFGLATLWAEGAAGASLRLHVSAPALLTGGMATFAGAVFAAWLALRQQMRRPALELLASRAGSSPVGPAPRRARTAAALGLGGLGAAVAASGYGLAGPLPHRPAAAFAAGATLLVAALAAVRHWLQYRQSSIAPDRLSLASLARANTARRPARSLAAVALLACGSFLVVVVGAHHRGPPADPTARTAGTGGFALLGRSALPVVGDRAPGAAGFRFVADQAPDLAVVPLRVRDGDDASCRSLERPQQPRLLGVDPELLAARGAFAFRDVLVAADSPWRALAATDPEGAIPAIGDAASVQWSLHARLGGLVPCADEQGRPFSLRIVGTLADSMLQGSLLIDERRFLERFPSTAGYRMFLVDAPPAAAPAAAARLTHDLADVGLELVPATDVLAAFDAVQNTWLRAFQLLGGLGLVLGCAGLGTVLLRNVAERRGELALLAALGLRRRTVRGLLAREHVFLLLAGTGAGTAAALLAAAVQSGGPPAGRPLWAAAVLLAGMVACGLLLVWLAASRALQRAGPAELRGL